MARMLKLCSNFNGVKALFFSIHGFRHFSTSTSTTTNPSFVNYLIEFLGFSNKQAVSTSTKLTLYRQNRGTKNPTHFNFIENANSVITYLEQIGLQQSHIATIICSQPNILLCNVDKTLKPKTQVFLNLGFSGSDFIEIVKGNPAIFFLGENTVIVPAFQALTELLGCKGHVIEIMKKKAGIRLSSVSKTLVPNVALLRSYGIPMETIRRRMLAAPLVFFRNTRVFEDIVIRVEEKFGIPREASSFLSAVQLLTYIGEKTMESKIQVFKSFGWSESDVLALFRSLPMCLAISEAKIKEKLGFLMNELGYDPKYVVSKTYLVTCSLEKRILPRHKILLILKEKGLLKMDSSLNTAICLTESKFFKKFVLPFKEVHEVYANHVGIDLKMLSNFSL